ncbi:MAG: isoleucine--tRNA ligase, partial [Oscillospiraceae bacterium]|nr:isoleucine--tRNA ligase [Oscillospiraceae bacterium]
ARADKRIGKSLEAHVTLSALDAPAAEALKAIASMNLSELFIVSNVSVAAEKSSADAVTGSGVNFPGLTVEVSEAAGAKCPRCWMHAENSDENGLCPRCAAVMKTIEVEL